MSEDNDVEVKFGASIEGLTAGVEEVKEKIEGLTEPISGIMEAFSGLGEAIVAALAVEKIAEFAEKMGELGEQTERTSKMLGMTTEQVGELSYIAAMTGTNTGNLAMMMGRFEVGLAQATTGTGRMAEGLKVLGLNAKELQGIPIEQQLDKIAEATSKFADGTNKTAALQSLGRGFVEMIPLLDEGSKGFDELREKATETGAVLDELTTDRLVNMQHGMVNLGETIKGLSIEAFKPFINVVNGAVALLTDIAATLMESARAGGSLHDILGLVAEAFQHLEQFIGETMLILKDLTVAGDTAATALQVAFQGFGQVVADVFRALAAAIPGFFTALVTAGAEAVRAVEQQFIDLGSVIDNTLHLNFAGAKAAFGSMGTDAAASAAKIGGAFKGVFDFSEATAHSKETVDKLAEIMGEGQKRIVENAKIAQVEYNKIWGIGDEKKEAKGPPPPQVAALAPESKGGKDTAAKDAAEEAAHEIKLAEDVAKKKEDLLDAELKMKKISESQWLSGTEDALAKELEATKAAYAKELETANLTAQQRKVINDKLTEAIEANAIKVQKAELKAAEESAKEWKGYADKTAELINGQVDGVLKGTTSISQAFKNMAASAIEDIIKFCVKWLAEHIATEAGVLAAHASGAAANKAVDSTAISGDAARAAAGAYAAVAGVPLIGPILAPVAAATAFVAVEAFGSFAVGSWSLPSDMLAQVHQGEMIVPAAQTPWVQSLVSNASGAKGGGGDQHFHFHGAIMDHQSVARVVRDQFNRDPQLRPAY